MAIKRNYKLTCYREFEASHRIPEHPKCGKLHGHTYKVTVVLSVMKPTLRSGMILDFGVIKKLLDRFDHTYLNEFFRMPTAENIALYIALKVLHCSRADIVTVTVNETTNNQASVTLFNSKF